METDKEKLTLKELATKDKREFLLVFLNYHYRKNEFRKSSSNDKDVDDFLSHIEIKNCDQKTNHHSVGYDHFSDNCNNKAKFNIVWKNASGTHSKNYCSIHKKLNEKFLSESKFDEIISVNDLPNE